MQTLNLASAPATENQAASILVMDDTGNVFCTIYADGRIKIIGEDAELIAPEMVQINLVQQNFDLFFKNVYDKKFSEKDGEIDKAINQIENVEQLLNDLWEYMDNKADSDTSGLSPNKEMVFRSRIEGLNIILK